MIFSSDIRAWVSLLLAVAGCRQSDKEGSLCEQSAQCTEINLSLPSCLAPKLKLSRLSLSVLTGTWQLRGLYYGFEMCFSVACLTFQHFHSHLYARLGMIETVRSGLDHPAKGSWSKSATWNTKEGSVGWDVNGAHVVFSKVKLELCCSMKRHGNFSAHCSWQCTIIYHRNLRKPAKWSRITTKKLTNTT